MSRIGDAFARRKQEDSPALVIYLTQGDPSPADSADIVVAAAEAGADVIELGVPHSDPIAEGPTIQAASFRALQAGTTLAGILEVCREVRAGCEVPLVLMGYLNNVLAFGEEHLVEACAAVGVDGLIVVDVPYEEGQTLQAATDAKGVHRVLLVAPTSPPDRVVQIASRSRGFVYCVSVTGVTGERRALADDLGDLVARVKRVTEKPVAVGFGISTPKQAAEVARLADGVIVGSALVSRIADAVEAGSNDAAIAAATAFVAELSAAIRSARR